MSTTNLCKILKCIHLIPGCYCCCCPHPSGSDSSRSNSNKTASSTSSTVKSSSSRLAGGIGRSSRSSKSSQQQQHLILNPTPLPQSHQQHPHHHSHYSSILGGFSSSTAPMDASPDTMMIVPMDSSPAASYRHAAKWFVPPTSTDFGRWFQVWAIMRRRRIRWRRKPHDKISIQDWSNPSSY